MCKAIKRLKQLKQAEEADGRGSQLWAATIASTRIGLGVGISSRTNSGAASPDDEDGGSVVIAMKRDESPAGVAYGESSLGDEAISAQPMSSPPAASHAHQLSPQDSIEMDESKYLYCHSERATSAGYGSSR